MPLETLQKFQDPTKTAKGETRASVGLSALKTLWFNTGTLCNLSCDHCYIESTPRNDRLAYISLASVETFLDEIEELGLPVEEIGLTGGEPFMNPQILPIMEAALTRGLRLLVLTNAMRPMMKCAEGLLDLKTRFADRLTLRVSVDHYTSTLHEAERGANSWGPMIKGLKWLSQNGFQIDVAGRTCFDESETDLRQGFAGLFAREDIAVDAASSRALVLFPEMDERADVPEITVDCWSILGVDPKDMMCASSRMVVQRKGEPAPKVLACTLLAYDPRFELGSRLREALGSVPLNHPHCAKFCVLGGGACSVAD